MTPVGEEGDQDLLRAPVAGEHHGNHAAIPLKCALVPGSEWILKGAEAASPVRWL